MKVVKESLNEKFQEKSDPIRDLAIGIPEHSYAVFTSDSQPIDVVEAIEDALEQFGIYITADPTVDVNEQDVYAFIFSKKELTKGEIDRIVEQRDEYGLDD